MRRTPLTQKMLLVVPLLLPVLACRAARPTKTEMVEIRKELGPGSLDLTDTHAGLAELASYESVLTVSFDGSKAEQSVRWANTYRLQVTKSPPARRLTVETSGNSDEPEQTSLAERSGAGYEWSAGKQCSAPPLDLVRSRLEQLEPAAALSGVLGAEEAGTETLNGVKATRYTFDERALGESGLTKSTGELWLASEGGYLLRYRLATKGDSGYFRQDTEGTLTWDYELTRAKQPLTIELPAGCPPGLVDAPMVPDASNVENDPGVLRYQTPATVAAAAAFYEKQLGALGWKLANRSDPKMNAMQADIQKALAANPQAREMMKNLGLTVPGQPPPNRNEDEVYLVFQKGNRVLRVLITRGEPATQILVLGNTGE